MTDAWTDDIAPELHRQYFLDPKTFCQRPLIRQALCGDWHDDGFVRVCWDRMVAGDFLGPAMLDAMPDKYGNAETIHGCSTISVLHAYHLFQMHNGGLDARLVSSIAEFGAGFGGMCRLLRRYGYAGTYTIVDLPPMREVQQDYLGHTDAAAIWADEPPHVGGLLIATFSLSETPPETRARVEAVFSGYDALYFAYCPSWRGTDEYAWFDAMQARHGEFRWTLTESRPGGRKRFLLGLKR